MRSIPRFLSRPQHDRGAFTLLSFVGAFLLNDALSWHIRVRLAVNLAASRQKPIPVRSLHFRRFIGYASCVTFSGIVSR